MDAMLENKSDRMPLVQAIKRTKQGVIMTDYTGHILFVNQTFCESNGYRAEEMMGEPIGILKLNMHNDVRQYQQMWITLYETGSYQGEVFARKKDGENRLKWLEVNTIKSDEGEITNFIFIFTDIKKLKHSQDKAYFLAYHDSLTKLPNRLYTQQYLKDLLALGKETQQLFAVLYIDLDRFKQVNDTLGHSYGDEVLIEASLRMKSCLRKDDIVSRMGGDEFICILSDITCQEEAEIAAKRIIETLSNPFYLNSLECYISASVGISFYPYDGDDIETLVTFADAALYKAKSAGKSQYKLASAEENAGAYERLVFENGLREALKNDSFSLHYQPQFDTKTRQVTGFEALLRWEHPDYGNITPADFIPLAEETGLIIPIGEWVLRTACKQNMLWQKEFGASIMIAVNISAKQFLQENFFAMVMRALDETKMPPSLLELEITETILMHQTPSTMAALQQLRNMGIRISIDDFGTGYSSLQYLKDYPIDTLKIDRSFISDIDTNQYSEAISSAVIQLAHNLNIKVVAEGVETVEQLTKLKKPNCDMIQGFLFSKPIPEKNVAHWLMQNQNIVLGTAERHK